MPIRTNSTKRRRHIRYAIALDAKVMVEKASPVDCVIQDFCTGGLFLSFNQSTTALSFPDHKHIKIHFSINPEHSWEEYRLDAEIMHVGPNGIGVAVANMPASVFEALKKEANIEAQTVPFDRRNSSSDKLLQENFKIEIKKMLDEQLPQLLDQFFKRFGIEFIKACENSPDFKDRSTLDDLITTIKFNRESITSEFCCSILLEVDHIGDFNQQKAAENAEEQRTLALIEKEDFEDWLNLSSVIRKLTADYKDRINQIDGKLSHIFGRPSHGVKNPISPGVLCDTFRENMLPFNLNNSTNLALYSIFEKTLARNLSRLYDEFNKILVIYGAPSQIVPHVIRQPDRNSSETRHTEHQKDTRHQDHKNPVPPSLSNDDLLNLLHLAEQKTKQPVTQVARKILDIIKETNPGSATTAVNGVSDTNRDGAAQNQPVYTADEVVAAIAKIQKNADHFGNIHHNPIALQKYLKDTLEHSDSSQKILSPSDSDQLEVYGKLFETLFNDLRVSSEIKSYMENIHLSLLALSLQGDDFLDSDTHPARNVLNQLATLESAVKGNKVLKKGNIKNTLDKLVTRIAHEASVNPNIFAEVEQELTDVTEQVTKSIDLNIRRMVETYEGQQKLETARRSVQQELDNRITGKPIPGIIPALLTSGWQHLLVITELNQERTREEKSKYYNVLDDLIVWLSDHDSDLEEQSDQIRATLAFIDDQLSTVCTNAFKHDKIIDDLTSCLIGVGSLRVRKAIGTTTLEPLTSDQSDLSQNIENHWLFEVEQLRTGEWLSIFRNSEGFEPMKLVWIGDIPPIFVFTNRDGLSKLELTKFEVAELMRNGAASKIENLDEPLMDRATNAMLQKMQETLIYNATHDPVTDLLTRDEFAKQFKHEISLLGNSSHVLCHIEVQDYRLIANSCGLAGSNQLLKKLTRMLTGQLRNEELFARLGDKAFGILFKHCSPDEGFEIAKKLVNAISDSHFEWEDKSYPIGVNIGLAQVTGNGYDVNQLMQQADSASISAKDGHNRIQLFKEDDERLKRQKKIHEWAGQIDRVLAENRIFIRCQKIAPTDPADNEFIHYEILMGVRDNVGNFVPPDHFIPAAECCQRMAEIDQWIIRHVFGWIEQNRNFFDRMDGFSINLSGQSINTEEFLEFLKELLASSNVPLEKITFEITESVAADSLVYVKKFIKQIKQFGCKFSLDDFGSGYSSYSYLKNLNVDYLKIDGAFVKDMANNPADVAIVKSMNEIAHSLGMHTIAEYVENDEIRTILTEIGVNYVQGYGIQKPILLTDLVVVADFSEDGRSNRDQSAAEANILAEALAADVLKEDSSILEIKDLAESHSPVEINALAENLDLSVDNDLLDDNEFWGF